MSATRQEVSFTAEGMMHGCPLKQVRSAPHGDHHILTISPGPLAPKIQNSAWGGAPRMGVQDTDIVNRSNLVRYP